MTFFSILCHICYSQSPTEKNSSDQSYTHAIKAYRFTVLCSVMKIFPTIKILKKWPEPNLLSWLYKYMVEGHWSTRKLLLYISRDFLSPCITLFNLSFFLCLPPLSNRICCCHCIVARATSLFQDVWLAVGEFVHRHMLRSACVRVCLGDNFQGASLSLSFCVSASNCDQANNAHSKFVFIPLTGTLTFN